MGVVREYGERQWAWLGNRVRKWWETVGVFREYGEKVVRDNGRRDEINFSVVWGLARWWDRRGSLVKCAYGFDDRQISDEVWGVFNDAVVVRFRLKLYNLREKRRMNILNILLPNDEHFSFKLSIGYLFWNAMLTFIFTRTFQ